MKNTDNICRKLREYESTYDRNNDIVNPEVSGFRTRQFVEALVGDLKQMLKNYFNGDTIYVEWNIRDIFRAADSGGIKDLTREEARNTLSALKTNYDPRVGIDYNTVIFQIWNLRNSKEIDRKDK